MAALISQAAYTPRSIGCQLVQKEPALQNRFLSPSARRLNLVVSETQLFSSLSSRQALKSFSSGGVKTSSQADSKHGTASRAVANSENPSNPLDIHPRSNLSFTPRKSSERSRGSDFRRRERRRGSVIARAFGGGGGSGDSSGKQLGNIAGTVTWGLIIWSALTGQLNWFFEGLTAITLVILAIPVLAALVFFAAWTYAQSRQIAGPCPTCGADLTFVEMNDKMMVVDTANPIPLQIPKNDDLSFDCPACRASLKVENKKIVRGRPSFESGVDTNVFSQMFERQQASGRSSGPIVDIEAEVRDKD